MTRTLKSIFIIVLAFVLQASVACTNNDLGVQKGSNQSAKTVTQTIPVLKKNDENYVSLQDLAQVLEFRSDWNETSRAFQMGDTDPLFEFKANSRQALKEGKQVELPAAPILIQNSLYLPTSAIDHLFAHDMLYQINDRSLVMYPNRADLNQDGRMENRSPAPPKEEVQGQMQSLATTVDVNKLIKTAEKYLGKPYKFGAGPYLKTGQFDCSSYTQYVFNQYGVKLPRVSRNQATVGKAISRNSLQKGDLVFFAVPGRFKSSKTVGHVGIYIGNNQMINALPKGGVQKTNINSTYWKKVYLNARRVAS